MCHRAYSLECAPCEKVLLLLEGKGHQHNGDRHYVHLNGFSDNPRSDARPNSPTKPRYHKHKLAFLKMLPDLIYPLFCKTSQSVWAAFPCYKSIYQHKFSLCDICNVGLVTRNVKVML